MKKIKSPYYGLLWILIWTAGIIWFLWTGIFNQRELAGLILVWLILVGITTYYIWINFKMKRTRFR
ncbi:MAG: hypothetical protein M1511_07550 [Deltaproteobacteria bacterium]|nr:hypothetical protein [Deltaproteobacteria bacterium]